jgi:phage tail sheath gpL-like
MSGSKILQPSVTVSLANADAEAQNTNHRVLIVGQMTSAGSATAGELQENISSSGAPEDTLFGPSSQLAGMIRAFKAINKVVRVDAIALDDHGSGVPRQVDFTVAGTPAAGTITVIAGSKEDYEFVITTAAGDTVTDVADAITAAIEADTKCPFSCSNVAGLVSLEAENDGTVANDLGVEVIISDGAGITVASVADNPAGSQDPAEILTTLLDNATERYQTIVWPWSDDTTLLETYLSNRWNASNVVMDGVGLVFLQDTLANLLTALDPGYNDQNVVIFCDKQESLTLYKGPSQNEASYVKLAMFAAIRSLRLTVGQPIGQYLTSSASLDQFGGPALASLPYFNTPMALLPSIPAGRGWTDVEIEQLATAGGSVMGMNYTGTSALVGEVVTTYKTDPASNDDPTWKYLCYVDTGSQAREYFHNNLKSRFAQSRLTEGSISRGRDMANAAVIQAYCEKLYQDLAGPDYVLVQDGEDAITFFKENLTVTLDLSIGKATITMLVPIVTQLRTIVATFKIAFSTTS